MILKKTLSIVFPLYLVFAGILSSLRSSLLTYILADTTLSGSPLKHKKKIEKIQLQVRSTLNYFIELNLTLWDIDLI